MTAHIYVAIEGAIGVGKTTLARLLQAELNAQLLLEVFEENPFLSDFYADRAKYAFQTQIFFLLSRYRQQHEVVQRLLDAGNLISDYTFAKDRIFARLNLRGDELDTYERLYSVLSENVPVPDLVVYLTADVPTLMQRIAIRDRAYERGMDERYIASLAQAYEAFFARYTETPLLVIDTNHLDYVRNAEHLAEVVGRIRSALGQGTHQPHLPPFAPAALPAREAALTADRRRLTDLQQWHRLVDATAGLGSDPYYHLISFQHRVGELAGYLAEMWALQETLIEQYGNREEALQAAIQATRQPLQDKLAECLAHILRLANRLGVDLESAYLSRIKRQHP